MKVCQTVNLLDENYNVVTLSPGDTVPEWAESRITNPDVIATDEVEAKESTNPEADTNAPAGDPEVADYTKLDKKSLEALLAERGLDTKGNKPDLIERLITADTAADDVEEVDVWVMTVAELKAHAAARGIDTGAAETTTELAAIIEQADTE